MNLSSGTLVSLAELGFVYLVAIYSYRFASGSVLVPKDKKELYQLWVRRNGNSVKRAILVLVTLLSAAILSKLFHS
ncbi:hypothetical protein WG947_04675 [Pontibacter sp. H259]|uniref:hypothetical protein n=1 Tax=Pontibacter sp. H259 TaxID=3133421 RepID=UPI0030BFD2A7